MKRLSKILVIIIFCLISCNEHNGELSKKNKTRVTFTSLENEPKLTAAIQQIGFQKSSNKFGRIVEQFGGIKKDSVLKVIQADSTNYTYTISSDDPKRGASFRNLVFQRVENGFWAFILEYTSHAAELNPESFSGRINKFDLAGKLLQEVDLKNVKLGKSIEQGRTSACFAEVTVECVEYRFGGWDHNTGAPFSECAEWAYVLTIDCMGGSGGGAGSTTGFQPGYGTFIPDPLGGPGTGAGGDGGTPPDGNSNFDGGIGILPPKSRLTMTERIDKWEDDQIQTAGLKPCMQTIVNDLKSITQGSVGQIIQKFSGTTPNWNWELKDGTLPGATGQTNPPALYNIATGTVTTVFDSQAWLKATELSWARTILHESIHAYLTVFFATDQANFIRSYSQMVQDWGTLQNWDAVHHQEFARSLVTAIADALQTYGVSKGYSLPRQFYEDMSWAGLQSTPTFKNLPSTDQARILDTIAVELTSMDTRGNSISQKGKNAGC